jgi:hypothetical protein
MPNISDEFAGEFVSHTVDLLRYQEGLRGEVAGMLQNLADDLEAKVRKSDVNGIKQTQYQIKRQEALLKQADKTIAAAYRDLDTHVSNQLLEIADIQKERSIKIVNDVFGANILSVDWTPKDLQVLVSNTMIQGAPSADWWEKQGGDLSDKFSQQVRMGVLAGESNDQLVRRIRGTDTGERRVVEVDGEKQVLRVFDGGIMNTSTREATALVRTSVQTVSNNVLSSVYDDNQDVLKGRQAVATLDARTTELCMSRDGGAWDFDGDPLEESTVQYPFPGPPPWHWQCRTVLIPITKSWQELIKEDNPDFKINLDEVSEGTRASMDGQVASKLSYEDWLKTKPEDFQKEVLGPGKWDLWNKGDITFADLVDQQGNPLTLDELKDKAAAGAEDARGSVLRDDIIAKHEEIHAKLNEIADERENVGALLSKLSSDLTDLHRKAEPDLKAIAAIEKQMEDSWKAMHETAAERNELEREGKKYAHEKLGVQSPIQLTATGIKSDAQVAAYKQASAATSVLEKNVQPALQFLSKIVSKDIGIDALDVPLAKTADVRSFQQDGIIFMHEASPTGVYVHELGHVLDTGDRLEKTAEFLAKRAAKDPKGLQQLKKIFPGSSYEEWEYAWSDGFQNPYTGKVYEGVWKSGGVPHATPEYLLSGQFKPYATEILSMGLQMLYDNPIDFAISDPEFFDFIVNLIRGHT